MPDLVAPPPDPQAATGAEFVTALQTAYPDPLNLEPYEVFALLEALVNETVKVKEAWKIALGTHGLESEVAQGFVQGISLGGVPGQVDASTIPTINDDLARWTDRLDYYLKQTTTALEHGVGAVDPAGRSEYYKQVTGPLIAGECFGEPSCSDALAAQKAPLAVHQMPSAAQIYVIETMMGEAKNVALNRTYGMLAAVSETAQDYATWLGDMIVAAAKKAGEALGSGLEGVSTGLGEEFKKLLWTAAAIAGIGAVIWFGGQAAVAGAKKK